MSELTLFKSRADVMGYAFRSGKTVHFLQGRYATSAKDEIEELTKECENGHPTFFIDPNEKVIDSARMDPISVLREQIRKEELAKLLAATNIGRDMGSTDQHKMLQGISNSQSVAGLIAGSESQALAANPDGFAATQTSQNSTPVTVGGVKVGAINVGKK